jgi:hypothetical protein
MVEGGGGGDSAGTRVSPENESKSIEVRPLSPSLSPTSAAVSIHPSVSHQQSSPRHRKTLPVATHLKTLGSPAMLCQPVHVPVLRVTWSCGYRVDCGATQPLAAIRTRMDTSVPRREPCSSECGKETER